MFKSLPTWGKRGSFFYDGSVKKGTIIRFGQNGKKQITADKYLDLLKEFSGQLVDIGASTRTTPAAGSVGAWLMENVTKTTAIASYVGPILVEEGYAEKVGPSELRFNSDYTVRYLLDTVTIDLGRKHDPA